MSTTTVRFTPSVSLLTWKLFTVAILHNVMLAVLTGHAGYCPLTQVILNFPYEKAAPPRWKKYLWSWLISLSPSEKHQAAIVEWCHDVNQDLLSYGCKSIVLQTQEEMAAHLQDMFNRNYSVYRSMKWRT